MKKLLSLIAAVCCVTFVVASCSENCCGKSSKCGAGCSKPCCAKSDQKCPPCCTKPCCKKA